MSNTGHGLFDLRRLTNSTAEKVPAVLVFGSIRARMYLEVRLGISYMTQPDPTVEVLVSDSGKGEHQQRPLLDTSTIN